MTPEQRRTLFQYLRWQYGVTRASQIMSGEDYRTVFDLRTWRSLGTRGRA